MERESFEDLEVAEALNKDFISIKVDREERPDIDHIYMTVCQVLTGQGGWPLTIIMTPDKKPFFAGTYFPKRDRMGMYGLLSILDHVKDAWKSDRERLLNSSQEIFDAIRKASPKEPMNLDVNIVERAFAKFKNTFDKLYGGFGDAPKFPTPHNLCFLLRYWHNKKDPFALEMVEKTLTAMHKGAIYDHIGYGFSRYSTDRQWLVPHFEKMLYDNALLAIAYTETYLATNNNEYAKAASEIFTYVLRDMTSKDGAFYSAEDADSEGEEGKFYVWTVDEIKSVLGNESGERFCLIYDITEKGNFEGSNIPNLIKNTPKPDEADFINKCRQQLYAYRDKRVHPYKDDKILTSWNGLMIAALAIGGRGLNNKEYTEAAEKAFKFIRTNLIREDGRLLARYRDGEAAYTAYVDDYAFLIWGLIELYETTYNIYYLENAIKLNKDLIKYFWDEENGGLFIYGKDSEELITRPKEIYDGATPSGNSVSSLNFFRLYGLTGDKELEGKGMEILEAFAEEITNYPSGFSFSLMALLYAKTPTQDIIVASDKYNIETENALNIINKQFIPFSLVTLYTKDHERLKEINPDISDYSSIEGKPTFYVCKNYTCDKPFIDTEKLKSL